MTARPEPTLGADEREPANAPLAGIDRDEGMDRTYIPLPGGWEVQTQGRGSSFRLCDTKSGQRWIITDKMAHKAIEQMARDVHAAALAAPAVAVSAEPVAPSFDLRTSAGGRGYVEWYFTNRIKRHDFNSYIREALAADFACALSRHLSFTPAGPDAVDARWKAAVELAHRMDDAAQHIIECQVYDFATELRVLAGVDGAEAADRAALASTRPSKGAA